MINLGIIGTGMMAGIIADSCRSVDINVLAVLSRNILAAHDFCAKHDIPEKKGMINEELFFSDHNLDAVYIATPTSEKERFLRYCLQYNKHALIEKPLPNTASIFELLQEADNKGLVWLDAAHFIHTTWYEMLDSLIMENIGIIDRVEASFFWPDQNKGQIKFNPLLEPDGAMGDLGWYPLRLISKFIPFESITHSSSILLHDNDNAIVEMNVSGHTEDNITFIGVASYRGSVVKQRCEISGTLGRLILNDFVMPYCGSFVYGNLLPSMCIEVEHGMKPLLDREIINISFPERQHVTMLRNFSRFIHSSDSEILKSLQIECRRTMGLSGFIRELSQG
ncbi:Gfo/Idh/MocA family oxidoreductase [Xenorhabdus sp. PR6a]|uniref:Gfo/Idh/MocA family protein n=1 Tax=Xenorhabdus sp. PR6a TaxID=3025877 RepID=UPI00235A0593|nr:Gfo/Idh/MocA family oxidoreductase [Xenorhabdus sp. PR6a]MDC9581485.1 Gfo/Idh/MocA family oxidoreductase [Xenorhabdus sp. PR6a]